MQVIINNTLSGDRWVQALEKPEVTVGRPVKNSAQGPDIALRSRLVSSVHALLRQSDLGWTLEHVGRVNDTQLGNQPIETGKAYPVKAGDEIRIGEFVLSLIEVTNKRPDLDTESGINQLIELERMIHNQLIDKMDLRRGESTANLESEEFRERIVSYLDALLDKVLIDLNDSVRKEIFTSSMYRRLSRRITASGSEVDQEQENGDVSNTPYEVVVAEIEDRMINELGITFKPKELEADTARLDKKFTEVLESYDLEFSLGVKDYLIRDLVKRDILDLIFGLGPLQDLLEMDSISEVMVVSKDQIFIEKFGVIEDSRRSFFSDEMLFAVIERIVSPVGRRIDRSSPLVDARLPNGSRVNAVIPPLAVKGPCITIRKFSTVPLEIEDLMRFGAISEQMTKFLRACVINRKNLVVSGGTGTGKTTLLNCLSRFIPYKERIVTIEDTSELQLKQSHVVTLESRPPNMEGKGAITIRDLVKNALRMRPDRIVVGECRGAETLDMLQAMNTGHDGSMTTAHANSPQDMMLRLETMVLMGTEMPVSAIREQIISAVDVVVQLTRFADGARRVTNISEIVGIDEDMGNIIVEDIFVYRERESGGSYAHTGYIPTFVEELLQSGDVDMKTFF